MLSIPVAISDVDTTLLLLITSGKFHGKGKYAFHGGDSYIGQWKRGKMNGEGVYYFKDGRQRSGEFVDGRLVESDYVESKPTKTCVPIFSFPHIWLSCGWQLGQSFFFAYYFQGLLSIHRKCISSFVSV